MANADGTPTFAPGDRVRIKHPTGGVLKSDVFDVVTVDGDTVVIKGFCGFPGRHRTFRFHDTSLERV